MRFYPCRHIVVITLREVSGAGSSSDLCTPPVIGLLPPTDLPSTTAALREREGEREGGGEG